MLAHRPSLDLLDGLDLDFLSVGYNGHGMLGGDGGQIEMGDGEAGGYSYDDDFLFDQGFDSTEAEDEAYHSDLFKLGAADRSDANWATQFRRSSLGGGSFDFTGSFFEGLGELAFVHFFLLHINSCIEVHARLVRFYFSRHC